MGTTLKISETGQITFKQEFLTHMGVAVGDELEIEKLPDGMVRVSARRQAHKTFRDFAGILQDKTDVRLSDDALEEAIHAAMGGLNHE